MATKGRSGSRGRLTSRQRALRLVLPLGRTWGDRRWDAFYDNRVRLADRVIRVLAGRRTKEQAWRDGFAEALSGRDTWRSALPEYEAGGRIACGLLKAHGARERLLLPNLNAGNGAAARVRRAAG